MADLDIPVAPALPGCTPLHSGKVRDLYRIDSGEHAGRLLMVASDRVSAYDHILQPGIPGKGEILTRMSLWWFDQLDDLVPHHVVSTDVPDQVSGRAVICAELSMFPVECVVRGYLTGSGLREYEEFGTVCAIELPPGLVDGSRLPEPIFTPATKAELGDHDENVSFDAVVEAVGGEVAEELRRLTLAVYTRAERLARERGIVLADTKLEFGRGADGAIVLADEVLTPDSSRFWSQSQWKPGQTQPSFDKDVIRNWLRSADSGWSVTSPQPPPALPEHVVRRTQERYAQAYRLLTGESP